MAAERKALYFGYGDGGHFLRDTALRAQYWVRRDHPDLPWTEDFMDTGLLKNGKVPDRPDGRVHWTCGGRAALWYAFVWWDRSGDERPASNSGFYVRGFGHHEAAAAFAYACEQFPSIIARQLHPLRLTE